MFAFPLSLTGSHLLDVFQLHSFPTWAAINALAIALLLWAAVSVLSRCRVPCQRRH